MMMMCRRSGYRMAAPLPIEHRPWFVSDVAAAIAVTGTADVAALILKIQRSHLARVMPEMPCTDEGSLAGVIGDRIQGSQSHKSVTM
jgi:hypothetical protein